MTSVLGVDGWRGAWVAARVSWSDGEDGEDGDDGEDGEVGKVGKVGKVGDGPARFLGWGAGRFAALLDEDDRVIAVDMPIGLPERGRRRCDVAARDVLRPAGSRVFAVPAHGAWAAEDLGAANVKVDVVMHDVLAKAGREFADLDHSIVAGASHVRGRAR